MVTTKSIQLSSIRIDGGTQPRAKIDEAVVAEYAAAMHEGAAFPPVVVFHDGVDNWLADGFHRFHAARKNEAAEIAADVRTGTKRDAVLFSVGANATHGSRRTNEDKRRAVLILLSDREWSHWSDREIARRCGVHNSSVGDIRKSILSESDSMRSETTFTHPKTGAPAQMRTENIGRRDSLAAERIAVPAQMHTVTNERPQAESRGVALGYAHKAISFLQQIPPNDGLRKEALRTVAKWIKDNP